MPRPDPFRVAILALLALLAGCGSSDEDDEAVLPPPDPALVATLAELHLADARAEITGAPRDSLRAVALRARGTDEAALQAHLDRLARDPAAADAVWAAVTARLDAERLGQPVPGEGPEQTAEPVGEPAGEARWGRAGGVP